MASLIFAHFFRVEAAPSGPRSPAGPNEQLPRLIPTRGYAPWSSAVHAPARRRRVQAPPAQCETTWLARVSATAYQTCGANTPAGAGSGPLPDGLAHRPGPCRPACTRNRPQPLAPPRWSRSDEAACGNRKANRGGCGQGPPAERRAASPGNRPAAPERSSGKVVALGVTDGLGGVKLLVSRRLVAQHVLVAVRYCSKLDPELGVGAFSGEL
jgi:hypothetical protein